MDLQISKPLRLQCGLILQNRLVKAAMAECFGGEGHLPNRRECLDAYEQWAKGGWGLIITGEASFLLSCLVPSRAPMHSRERSYRIILLA